MTTLSRYLPRIALRQLSEFAETTSVHETTHELSQNMQAAAIFADASGFTALTEKLSALPNGAELMCKAINAFLTVIVACVHEHGGDVVKFAGDAVLCIFPLDDNLPPGMRAAVVRAAACATQLHERCHEFVAWSDGNDATLTLSLHVGVGCGQITMLHLGTDRCEIVLAGPAIRQCTEAEPRAKSGQTCIAPEAWAYLQDVARGHPIELLREESSGNISAAALQAKRFPPTTKGAATHSILGAAFGTAVRDLPSAFPSSAAAPCFMLLEYLPLDLVVTSCGVCAKGGAGAKGSFKSKASFKASFTDASKRSVAPAPPPSASGGSDPRLHANMVPYMRRYVPITIALKLAADATSSSGAKGYSLDISEMRHASVMFLQLKGLDLEAQDEAGVMAARRRGWAALQLVRKVVSNREGQVNKMLVDDKGTVLLCAFGLPPRPHSDDPLRAVRCAIELSEAMDGAGEDDTETALTACIGVATGRLFCGVVGSPERREYTTMGDVVNVAARLMQLAAREGGGPRVRVDEETMACSSEGIKYRPLKARRACGRRTSHWASSSPSSTAAPWASAGVTRSGSGCAAPSQSC